MKDGMVHKNSVECCVCVILEALRERQEAELQGAEIQMLNFSLGQSRRYRVKNKYIMKIKPETRRV